MFIKQLTRSETMRKTVTDKRVAAAALLEGIYFAIDSFLDASEDVVATVEQRKAAQEEAWKIAESMIKRLETITGDDPRHHLRREA